MRAYNLQTARQHPEKITELYLQQSGLTAFPEFIFRLPALTKLHIQSEQLAMLPVEIGQMHQLESLLLDNCQLKQLPQSLFLLPNLRQLSLSNNQLTHLPEGSISWPCLEILKLGNNQLTEIPANIWELPRLRSLGIEHNAIKKLSIPKVKKMAPLRKLNAEYNQLSHLPKGLFLLKELEELRLSKNRLTRVSDTIRQLEKLSILDLSGNRIKALPEEMGQLLMLRRCNLSNNALDDLPGSMRALPWLAQLELNKNRFAVFPKALQQIPRLTHLSMKQNQLTALPAHLPPLFYLDVSNNQISNLPPLPSSLEILDASKNQLHQLSDSISRLVHLKKLDLGNNQLNALPQGFRRLQQLEELKLSNNHFDTLSASLFMLEDLRLLKGVGDAENRRKLLRFLRVCRQRSVPGKLRLLAYDLLENNGQELAGFPLPLLLEALQLGISDLATPIRQHLFETRFSEGEINEIPPGSRFYFVGATGYDKKWLKKQLPMMGFEWVEDEEQPVDYLVLGRLLRAMNEKMPLSFQSLLSRKTFTRLLLLQKGTIHKLDDRKIDNLRRLLFHQDKSSRQLAIQILKGVDVPESLLTDLFVAWKLGYGVGKQLEKLLLQNVSEAALHAMYLPLGLSGSVSANALITNIQRYCEGNEFNRERMHQLIENH